MPTYFQRPENALKRANEFIDVGKKQRALDALYDVIKSKRHRTWQKIHEPIMEKYLQLCVELKKSHVAKEGLYQYKNICQQVNTKSLEDIVKKYLALAEEKTDAARQESQQTADDVDDLDVLETPESLLMSAVSGEDMQDRTDRAILTPWLKFLWESYRQCLELLRNNQSVEKLYHEVAQSAFKFCLKYNRKTEFRKLCENLRTHLSHLYKHQNQQRAININNPETQYMHLETRLVQLDSAIQMELWQEAYKAVEDIHTLIALARKSPRPSLMATYLQKFGLVLYKSDNFMFHACAWHKLFHLYRDQRKTLSEHELQKQASRVLCATLAIPLPAYRNQTDQLLDLDESGVEKQKRLATLLSLPNLPTRQTLVKDLVKYNIVQCVYPELQNLYHWLEVDFNPLKLASRVQSSLEFINKKEELVQYSAALQDITIMRIVKQISEVYQTIDFAHLTKLVPFASNYRLEKIIVNAAKTVDLQVRIDHRNGTVTFGTGLGITQDVVHDGPSIQSMPSEQIRNQLVNMSNALDKAMNVISSKELRAGREELQLRIMQNYRQTAKKDHITILRRRQIIEDRKEEIESISILREKKEQEILAEQHRKQVEEETFRLEREAEERDKLRRAEEHRDIQRKVAKERIDQLKRTTIGDRALSQYTDEQLADMDPDDILAKQVEQLEKEKKELQEKLKSQEKKVDYFERARYLEEIPLLQKYIDNEKTVLKQFWDQQEEERIDLAQKERLLALELRERLERTRPDRDEFLARLKAERASVFKDKLHDFEKKLGEERIKRLDERRRQRREDRRRKWHQDKEEEEQRRKDEELKRQREEEERIAHEKREREEAEYNEKARKLAEIEEKKRQREQEIEEKMRRKVEEKKEPSRDDEDTRGDSKSTWRLQPKEGGWRAREKTKEESWRPRSEEDTKFKASEEADSRRDERTSKDDRLGERRRDPSPVGREERRWDGGRDVDRDAWRRATPSAASSSSRGDDKPPQVGGGGSGWRERTERSGDDWRKEDRPRREYDDRTRDERAPREFDRAPRGSDRDFNESPRDRGWARDKDRQSARDSFDRTPTMRDSFERPRDRDAYDRPARQDDSRGARDGGRDFRNNQSTRDWRTDDNGRAQGGQDAWRSKAEPPRDANVRGEKKDMPTDNAKSVRESADSEGWRTVKHT